jgi:hypothetical protein
MSENKRIESLSYIYALANCCADFEDFEMKMRKQTITAAFTCPRCAGEKITSFIIGFLHYCNDCKNEF